MPSKQPPDPDPTVPEPNPDAERPVSGDDQLAQADESKGTSEAARAFGAHWADDLAEAVGLSKARYDRATLLHKSKLEGTDTSKWWRAMGLVEVPDDVVAFGREDLAMARALRVVMAQDENAEEHVFRLARLLGGSFSRIAEAQTRVLEDLLSQTYRGDLDSPSERMEALTTPGTETLLELLDQSMSYVSRRHLFAALGRWIGAEPDDDEKVAGFVDISGFSQMSKRTEPDALARVVETFESEAVDVVSHHGGRVVKFIGDEAFFVVDDIPAAVDVAFAIGDRMAECEPAVALHSGLATGPMVSIAGDVFGNTVNLAKRLTDVARKGKIVMPKDDAEQLRGREDLVVRRVTRSLDLKGVGRTSAVSVGRRKSPG
ncbi:MAG: adenylate/guanylate cyclase domain-containing protein [Microthrixaceae bacterium]